MPIIKRSSKLIAGLYLTAMASALVTGFQNCAPGFEIAADSAFSLSSKSIDPLEITSAVASPSRATAQSFSFKVPATRLAEVAQYKCKLDAGAEVVCTTPFNLNTFTEGPHHLDVSALAALGYVVATGSSDFLVDLTPPAVTINMFPGAVSGSATLSATFSAVDSLTNVQSFECKLDTAAAAPCTSPISIPNLAEGAHTFTISSTDVVGNKSVALSKSWTISSVAPILNVTPVAATVGSLTSISFTASSRSGLAVTTKCSLDGAAPVTCTSPFATGVLQDGPHSVVVTATDPVNNEASARIEWYSDLTPPVVAFKTPQNAASALLSFPIEFTATDARSTIAGCTCAKGAGPASACTSPYAVAYATDGVEKATVICRDSLGNTSLPAVLNFYFDRTPPNISATYAFSNPSKLRDLPFTVTATDSVTATPRISYSLDGGAFITTPSPVIVHVSSDGPHSVVFRATDLAGNVSAPTSSSSFVVDSEAPTAPSNLTFTQTFPSVVKFAWTPSTDTVPGVIKYEYQVGTSAETGDIEPVANNFSATSLNIMTFKYRSLANPFYYFSVRAVDAAGNASPWAVAGPRSFRIDSPYLACATGICNLTTLLDTSLASLTRLEQLPISPFGTELSSATYTGYLVEPLARLKVNTYNGLDPYTEYVQKFGGSFQSQCTYAGIAWACSPGAEITLPTYVPFSRDTLTIQISRDGQKVLTSSYNVTVTPFATPTSSMTTVGTSMYFGRSHAFPFGMAGTIANVWTAPGTSVSIQANLMPAAGSSSRFVVADNSMLSYFQVDPFNNATTVAYVGRGSVFLLGTGGLDDLWITPGSIVSAPTGWQTRVHVLNGVPGDPCLTPAGAGCPADTIYVQ